MNRFLHIIVPRCRTFRCWRTSASRSQRARGGLVDALRGWAASAGSSSSALRASPAAQIRGLRIGDNLPVSSSDLAIVLLSLKVALVATVVSLPVAIAVALLLARVRFWGRSLLNALVHLPLVLPPVVTGYLLLVLFGREGAIGAVLERTLGLVVAFRWTGAALAAGVMGFPLMVRAIRLAIEHVDPHLEDAAASLGASRAWTIATVTLPLALPGVLAGAILAFAKSLGEFGATITFVSNIPGETRTLALAIYTFIQTPGSEPHVWRLVALSMAVSFGAVLVSEALARRMESTRR
ncbi:MAG: molybdate ABC transporter permease subunit [Acidobacteria bacterium]|nr:molybdate ABC transporter permease subunit [Acidobacteriota bacterium]